MTIAHIGGLPVEETLGSVGPALLLAFGVAWANLSARIAAGARSRRRARRRRGSTRSAGCRDNASGNTRTVGRKVSPRLERSRAAS
jgi:hypothetical protein